MPELPDIEVYVEALAARVSGEPLERIRLASPFLLRTVEPPIAAAAGRRVVGVSRLGKQIVFELEGDLFLVVHLMISGRFHWRKAGAALNRKTGLAAFDFPPGSLILTETASRKRASLHVIAGAAELVHLDRGGLEPLEATQAAFHLAVTRENHTLKRTLTDPRILSGIGNSFSDEILHRARLSPLQQTRHLADEEIARLYVAVQETLRLWIDRLRRQTGDGFPEKVTVFRPEMAVHGKYDQPCPDCGAPVQRIVYAANECNYCARCQTGEKLLADRALSRLLKKDWPHTLEELDR